MCDVSLGSTSGWKIPERSARKAGKSVIDIFRSSFSVSLAKNVLWINSRMDGGVILSP